MSAVLKPRKSKPVKERVGRQEWQLRVDLAAAYQLAAQFERPDREAARKDWPALLRLLERKGIDYRG